MYPDDADRYYQIENATRSIRFSIAALVVIFPLYLWLTREVNNIRQFDQGKYLTLTKWLIYLSLVVGGGTLAGDLIAVINQFLNGELTTRFVLKALVLAAVIFVAFYYYLKDANGYWQLHRKTAKLFAFSATIFVVAGLLLGFVHSKTPQEVRDEKIDNNQVTDLQDIQHRIEGYYNMNERLPVSIVEAYDALSAPDSPKDRMEYEYRLTSKTSYKLCATFAQESPEGETRGRIIPSTGEYYTWAHNKGYWCFDRTVTPKTAEPID